MGLENGIEIDLSESILKNGKAIAAIPIADNNDKKEIITDSVKNCRIRPNRLEPNVLRIPTSLALLSECAVDKFMKLTDASRIRKNPITDKI